MRNTLIHRAYARPRLSRVTFGPWRASIGAAAVLMLLTLLFAATILAALQPHAPVEPTQAAIEGGL